MTSSASTIACGRRGCSSHIVRLHRDALDIPGYERFARQFLDEVRREVARLEALPPLAFFAAAPLDVARQLLAQCITVVEGRRFERPRTATRRGVAPAGAGGRRVVTARRKPRTISLGRRSSIGTRPTGCSSGMTRNLEFPLHVELIAAIPEDLPGRCRRRTTSAREPAGRRRSPRVEEATPVGRRRGAGRLTPKVRHGWHGSGAR